jgi:hypothetical protein
MPKVRFGFVSCQNNNEYNQWNNYHLIIYALEKMWNIYGDVFSTYTGEKYYSNICQFFKYGHRVYFFVRDDRCIVLCMVIKFQVITM